MSDKYITRIQFKAHSARREITRWISDPRGVNGTVAHAQRLTMAKAFPKHETKLIVVS